MRGAFISVIVASGATFALLVGLWIKSEYVPREVFKIRTVNGEIINLACPVVGAGGSPLEYTLEGYCVIYKNEEKSK